MSIDSRKKTVLVTGAGGVVGSGMLEVLHHAADVSIIGVYRTKQPPIAAENVTYLQADLAAPDGRAALMAVLPDVVIHCAAVLPSAAQGCDQHDAARANRVLDAAAIALCRETDSTLIYFSTAGVYGHAAQVMFDETSAVAPSGEYFSAKLETEETLASLGDSLKHFVFRISSPYGRSLRSTTVLGIFVRNAIDGQPLVYYGSGSRSQDFIFTADIAAACEAAFRSNAYGVYNIASGSAISMKDLAALVKRCAGSGSDIVAAEADDLQEGLRLSLSIEKAGRLLGWRPRYSLEQGLSIVIDALRSGASV